MKARGRVACTFLSFFLSVLAGSALASKDQGHIHLSQLTVRPGEAIQFPLQVDNIANLAGIKLVIEYDHKRVLYKGLRKAAKAGSLMHMVNDKKPGSLILVMAGAEGISLNKEPLAFLQFMVDRSAQPGATVLHISHVEVMSDTLKPLPVRTTDGEILIQDMHNGKESQTSP